MTTIKYAASGEQRKKLVNALSEILECESKYLKAPSYGYEVGSCVVNRTGDIEFPDTMAEKEVEAIVKKLTWHGFEQILDEPAEEADNAPISEAPSLETDGSTEETKEDVTETTIEASEETSEVPTLPEGNFESTETAEEAAEEQSEETFVSEATDPKKIVIELPGSYLDDLSFNAICTRNKSNALQMA